MLKGMRRRHRPVYRYCLADFLTDPGIAGHGWYTGRWHK